MLSGIRGDIVSHRVLQKGMAPRKLQDMILRLRSAADLLETLTTNVKDKQK